MEVEMTEIKSTYLEGLKLYLSTQDEVWLSQAFEKSQSALKEGVNGLDLIHLHHEALPAAIKENSDLELESAVELASTYLIEWMIAYDVKVRSFRRLVNQLNQKNEKLKNEIDQRNKAQEELEESKEYFRTLIENAHDIITVLDEDGNVCYDTPSVYRILGYNQRELVGNNAFDFVHPNDVAEVKQAFRDTIDNSGKLVSVEFRFQHKNGNWIYLESLAKHVPDTPEGSSVIVNSRDVTSRHQRIRKLNEQRIKLTEAQKIAKVGSWEWDIKEETSEIVWSDEVYRIFGLEKKDFDMNYDTYTSHIHPDDKDKVEEMIKQSYKNREPFSLQHRIIRGDGECRHVSCRGRTVSENEGESLKMLGTIQDITEQKERENQLQVYSEKLRELSERIERTREEERTRIAREIHDELGQMLTVLKIDMSLCNEAVKRKISDELSDFVDREMQQMMNRVNTIIESVHSITTKLRPEVLDDLEITEAVEWQAKELAQRVGLSVELNSSLDITSDITDEQKTTLFRIFQEAMNNIVRHAEATKVNIDFKKRGGDLLLIIKDDGIGITQQEKDARSSFGIIGMRERARFLGGDIYIESQRGKGTQITVKIPLNDNRDTNTKVE